MKGKHTEEALKIKQLDEIEIGYKKQNAKIIELPNTRKSNK